MQLARRLWTMVEPYHAVIYFAREMSDASEAAGLRGFWRGYFAGRAAPLGAVGPDPVVGAFYGFHPDFVSRALPSVCSMATPDRAIEARLAGVDAALRSVLDVEERVDDFARTAGPLREITGSCLTSVLGLPDRRGNPPGARGSRCEHRPACGRLLRRNPWTAPRPAPAPAVARRDRHPRSAGRP